MGTVLLNHCILQDKCGSGVAQWQALEKFAKDRGTWQGSLCSRVVISSFKRGRVCFIAMPCADCWSTSLIVIFRSMLCHAQVSGQHSCDVKLGSIGISPTISSPKYHGIFQYHQLGPSFNGNKLIAETCAVRMGACLA